MKVVESKTEKCSYVVELDGMSSDIGTEYIHFINENNVYMLTDI